MYGLVDSFWRGEDGGKRLLLVSRRARCGVGDRRLMRAYVAVGTADGWLEPQLVEMDIDRDFVITNVAPVNFGSVEQGCVLTRAAVWVRGQWCAVELEGTELEKGQNLAVAPRSFVVIAEFDLIDGQGPAIRGGV